CAVGNFAPAIERLCPSRRATRRHSPPRTRSLRQFLERDTCAWRSTRPGPFALLWRGPTYVRPWPYPTNETLRNPPAGTLSAPPKPCPGVTGVHQANLVDRATRVGSRAPVEGRRGPPEILRSRGATSRGPTMLRSTTGPTEWPSSPPQWLQG